MTKVMKRVMVLVLSLAMVVGMFPAASSVSASKKTNAIKCKTNDSGDVFDFSKGDSALYCHELTAISYMPNIKVERYIPKILGGLIHGKHEVFLAQSFLDSHDFYKVYESIPSVGLHARNCRNWH